MQAEGGFRDKPKISEIVTVLQCSVVLLPAVTPVYSFINIRPDNMMPSSGKLLKTPLVGAFQNISDPLLTEHYAKVLASLTKGLFIYHTSQPNIDMKHFTF